MGERDQATQLVLELSSPAFRAERSPERRIDVTLARVATLHEAMTDQERAELDGKRWWTTIVVASRMRAMERAEEEVLGRPSKGLADAYDRVISPGENAA